MKDVVFIYTTWPDAETADRAGRAAVEQRHAACANILAPIVSIFRWEGIVDSAAETPVVFKTTAEASSGLRELILTMHPYEIPCIVALPISAAQSHPAFLDWIASETG